MTAMIPLLKSYVMSHHDLYDWLEAYCKRNKIVLKEEDHYYLDGTKGTYFKLFFNSGNQAQWFLIMGRKNYPYFEFI